jgi:hypothetical protein
VERSGAATAGETTAIARGRGIIQRESVGVIVGILFWDVVKH